MSEHEAQYISINDIPQSGAHALEIYPYQEWARDIPPGMALEITKQLNGQKVKHVRATIHNAFKRHNLPLKVVGRKERIFIVQPAESAN